MRKILSQTDPEYIIIDTLSPYENSRIKKFDRENLNFSHYTTPNVAKEIIKKQKIWMRNSRKQNDTSEIKHGEDFLIEFWNKSPVGLKLIKLLQNINPKIVNSIKYKLNMGIEYRLSNTYTTSFSEYDQRDNNDGRLFMWQSYGGPNGVSMVFAKIVIYALAAQKDINLVPVLYGTYRDYEERMRLVVDNIEARFDKLKGIDPILIERGVHNWLHFSVLATKNPAFSDEREWRFICTHTTKDSKKITPSIGEIRGQSEEIRILNLDIIFPIIHENLKMDNFIEKIIIGPSCNQENNLNELLSQINEITNLDWSHKLLRSTIPLTR